MTSKMGLVLDKKGAQLIYFGQVSELQNVNCDGQCIRISLCFFPSYNKSASLTHRMIVLPLRGPLLNHWNKNILRPMKQSSYHSRYCICTASSKLCCSFPFSPPQLCLFSDHLLVKKTKGNLF